MGSVIMLFILNINFWNIMYTSVTPGNRLNLFLRVTVINVALYCILTAIQSLPLVMVVLVKNLSPLLTAVAAYVILKEKITRLDVFILLASFLGVILLITGTQNT